MVKVFLLVVMLMMTGPVMAGSLHNAVVANDAALVVTLLREGAAVDEKNKTGETPLLLAVTNGKHKNRLVALAIRPHPSMRKPTTRIRLGSWLVHRVAQKC